MKHIVVLIAAILLSACAQAPRQAVVAPGHDMPGNSWAQLQPGDASWEHYTFPGKKPTQFGYTRLDGRDAMAATSHASASMLRRKMYVKPVDLSHMSFSWKVPELMKDSDMAVRDKDDAPARVVLAFDGDRSRLSGKNAMLSELARALTGEEMPYATLMYVWSNARAPGTVIVNPRTDRIRKLVVESGPAHLNQWRDYHRDIRADFEKAFGEPPGALIGIGVMTDSDNTQMQSRAWYGPIRLLTVAPTP